MKFIKNKLKIENVIIENIVKKYDTPIYCYSYKQLRENINKFKRSFRSFPSIICFAISAASMTYNLARRPPRAGPQTTHTTSKGRGSTGKSSPVTIGACLAFRSRSNASRPRLNRHGCTSPVPASERLERYAAAGRPLQQQQGGARSWCCCCTPPRGRFEGEKGLVW